MKISKKTEYALLALTELARPGTGAGRPVQARELARRRGIPVKFLEQILVTLKTGGLVRSRRGCNGGYVLARPPRDISLGEVVRLFEGTTGPVETLPQDDDDGPGLCGVQDIMCQVEEALGRMLDGFSLQDVYRRGQELRVQQTGSLLYSI